MMKKTFAHSLSTAVFIALMNILLLFDGVDGQDFDEPITPAKVQLGRPAEFHRDVFPVLKANCLACHNATEQEGSLIVEKVEGILQGGDSGPAIVPGKPDESLLYLQAARVQESLMPPMPNDVQAKPLTPTQVGLLRQWILDGAKVGAAPKTHAMKWRPVPERINSIHSVALSPDGRFIACGRANQICIHDAYSHEVVARPTDPRLDDVPFEGTRMYPEGAAHRDYVHSLAFSPDGTTLASGGYRVVKLWQKPTNPIIATLETAGQGLVAAISADRKWVAAETADHDIQIRSQTDGQVATTLRGHGDTITGLAFSADGQRLISASRDKTIRVWNIADASLAGSLETPSPINAMDSPGDAGHAVTAHDDGTLRVWEILSNHSQAGRRESSGPAITMAAELTGHTKAVTTVRVLATDEPQVVSGGEDGTVRIWNPQSGEQIRSIEHGGSVTSVSAMPDGNVIASASDNGTAKLWNRQGKPLLEVTGDPRLQRVVGKVEEDLVVAGQRVENTDQVLAVAKKEVAGSEEALKKAKEEWEKTKNALQAATEKVRAASEKLKAAKDQLAANTEDDTAKKKVDDAEKELDKQKEQQSKAADAEKSANQSVELAEKAFAAGKARVEQATKKKESLEAARTKKESELQQAKKAFADSAEPIRSIALSADGSRVATGTDQGLIHLWNSDTGEFLETLAGHEHAVRSIVFTDGEQLVSAANGGDIILWDLNPSWRMLAQLGPEQDETLDTSNSALMGRVLALDFSNDGALLATGGGLPSRAGEITFWDVSTLQMVRQIAEAHSDTVFGVEFSRDGEYLLSGAADKLAKVFRVGDGAHVRTFEGHTNHVLDVAWKADGDSMVTAGADNAIKYWEVHTGKQIRTINSHSKQITSIQFVGTSNKIISCSGDRTVRIHTANNGRNVRRLSGSTDYVYAVSTSSDSSLVVAGGEDGVLRLWDGNNGKVLATLEPDE